MSAASSCALAALTHREIGTGSRCRNAPRRVSRAPARRAAPSRRAAAPSLARSSRRSTFSNPSTSNPSPRKKLAARVQKSSASPATVSVFAKAPGSPSSSLVPGERPDLDEPDPDIERPAHRLRVSVPPQGRTGTVATMSRLRRGRRARRLPAERGRGPGSEPGHQDRALRAVRPERPDGRRPHRSDAARVVLRGLDRRCRVPTPGAARSATRSSTPACRRRREPRRSSASPGAQAIRLKLTKALPLAMRNGKEHRFFAWRLVLRNGDVCDHFTGTAAGTIQGHDLVYGCRSGGTTTDPVRAHAFWTVSYLPKGGDPVEGHEALAAQGREGRPGHRLEWSSGEGRPQPPLARTPNHSGGISANARFTLTPWLFRSAARDVVERRACDDRADRPDEEARSDPRCRAWARTGRRSRGRPSR